MAIFRDDADRRQFLALLRDACQRYGAVVHAFCLMTNHLHITLEDRRGELSRTLHLLNSVYAKRFNHRHGRTGHLFERRFWSSLIETDVHLVTVVEYVHRNPLEAGMVAELSEYRWSSYPCYLGARSSPSFLETGLVLGLYRGDRDELARSTLRADRDHIVEKMLGAVNPPPVIGSTSFARSALGQIDVVVGTESSFRKVVPDGPTMPLDDLVKIASACFQIPPSRLQVSVPGQPNPHRSVTLFVAQRVLGHTLRSIAEYFGGMSVSAVSVSNRRFESRLAVDGECQRLLAELRAAIAVADLRASA